MMQKRWLLFVVSVALSIDLTLTLAVALQGDPLGVEWRLQKADKLPYPVPRIEEAKPQVFKSQSEETKPKENYPPIGAVKVEPPTGTQDTKPQAKDQKTNADKPIDYQWWFNFLLVLFNAGLVTIGALQYHVYKEQARYMEVGLGITRDSADAAQLAADAAKQSAEATERSVDFAVQMERPWIQVEPIQPDRLIAITQQGLRLEFYWTVKNVGKSPAFLTKVYFAADPRKLPAPHEELIYREPDDPIAEFLLPPNGERKLRADGLILPSDFESIRSGEKFIVFYGRVEYRDTGGECHHTKFFSYWCSAGPFEEDLWTFFPTGPPYTIEYT